MVSGDLSVPQSSPALLLVSRVYCWQNRHGKGLPQNAVSRFALHPTR